MYPIPPRCGTGGPLTPWGSDPDAGATLHLSASPAPAPCDGANCRAMLWLGAPSEPPRARTCHRPRGLCRMPIQRLLRPGATLVAMGQIGQCPPSPRPHSSGVEHSLGKREVESSNLSVGTIPRVRGNEASGSAGGGIRHGLVVVLDVAATINGTTCCAQSRCSSKLLYGRAQGGGNRPAVGRAYQTGNTRNNNGTETATMRTCSGRPIRQKSPNL